MAGYDGTFCLSIVATIGTFLLVPAHGSAQDSRPDPCADVTFESRLDELTRCAERGFGRAQFFLAVTYGNGRGVPRDNAKALHWFRLSAERGWSGAQFNLGMMYNDDGLGVDRDDEEAVYWLRLAAEQGHITAQHNLGVKYANGEGVPADLILAYKWWSLAASKGNDGARANSDIIAQQMTREQISEAQRQAMEWIESPPPCQRPRQADVRTPNSTVCAGR